MLVNRPRHNALMMQAWRQVYSIFTTIFPIKIHLYELLPNISMAFLHNFQNSCHSAHLSEAST